MGKGMGYSQEERGQEGEGMAKGEGFQAMSFTHMARLCDHQQRLGALDSTVTRAGRTGF